MECTIYLLEKDCSDELGDASRRNDRVAKCVSGYFAVTDCYSTTVMKCWSDQIADGAGSSEGRERARIPRGCSFLFTLGVYSYSIKIDTETDFIHRLGNLESQARIFYSYFLLMLLRNAFCDGAGAA